MKSRSAWQAEIDCAAKILRCAGVDSPDHDARELAFFAAGTDGVGNLADTQPTSPRIEFFRQLVQRRASREPLQHILGHMYFRYLELEAQPGVFIVRPETEMVAQAGIDFLTEYYNGASSVGATGASGIADSTVNRYFGDTEHYSSTSAVNNAAQNEPIIAVELFSGSGAIALSIATELRERIANLAVYGFEISSEAYESSQRNNATYGNIVNFIHSDALAPLPEHLAEDIGGKAALVIANPPYVPPYHKLSPEVCADPALALFGGGEDGLDIPLATIKHSTDLLAPGGALVMEHASEQALALRDAATRVGFIDVRTGKDLTGTERWLFARWPYAM